MNLSSTLFEHFRLTDAQKAALGKLGIKTVRDLLYHLPSRYEAAGQEGKSARLFRPYQMAEVQPAVQRQDLRGRHVGKSGGQSQRFGGQNIFGQPAVAKNFRDRKWIVYIGAESSRKRER